MRRAEHPVVVAVQEVTERFAGFPRGARCRHGLTSGPVGSHPAVGCGNGVGDATGIVADEDIGRARQLSSYIW